MLASQPRDVLGARSGSVKAYTAERQGLHGKAYTRQPGQTYARSVSDVQVSEALAALAVLRKYVAGVEAMPGSEAKLAAIVPVASELTALGDKAGAIRIGEIQRVWQTETLSLGEMAARANVSKARIHQATKGLTKGKADQ